MGKEYTGKSFRSGNSVALRLPAAMRIEPGREWRIIEEGSRFTVEPIENKRKIDVSKFWGKAPWLKPLTREEREFDNSPRVWDDPDWPGWSDKKV